MSEIKRNTVEDIAAELKRKYAAGEIRQVGDRQTVEIQNANFICTRDYIIREPSYEYVQREIEWYKSQSLFVEDIPGKVPPIWVKCADHDGKINSNYGWCIWSNENGNQYKCCLRTLLADPQSRQAVMLYTRPSMQKDATENGRHDFMCTYAVQCFLNPANDGYSLKYIVYMRSNDAVYGYNNDYQWHKFVQEMLADDYSKKAGVEVTCEPIEWNAASLHVYDKQFDLLK